ncbi:Uncharacterized conserved protein, DUF58 family, contains vWF domain [Agrococcus baldri]|uniref:Uncharacterized conserved protein, DUF58 family, contains vWF domain n=1 Tax=Agrococcus baldri TaxID=153730 RepID=A0AA94HK92_9MICO|nr:DUF58 domain-containing protein [Agrococcus baldri]SFR98810.1 Uncharacterized conserved protein, DUF58 family, contains vWF domain [Agrococcus baldri]
MAGEGSRQSGAADGATSGDQSGSRRGTRRQADRSSARPTPRGGVLLMAGALLLVAAYWERQVVLLVPAALCLSIVLLGAWWAIGAVGSVRLGVPGVVQEGADASLRIAGERRHAGARWSTWAPGPERYLLLEGELDGEGRDTVRLGEHARGRWRLAPVSVTALDPFRVMRTTRTVDPLASLVVGPEVLAIPSSALRSNREEGRLAQSRTADNVDAMVREWRPGDPQRRVHWRQSAKRGQLMVRQEANPSSDDDLVVVDTAAAADADRDAQDRLARAACSIVRALAGQERTVVVHETGEPSILRADWRDLPAALAAFASMEAVERAEPERPGGAPAHVIALEESAPETWTLTPGTTLWLVAARDAPPRRIAPGSRVRIQRWIDRVGPVRELS